MKDLELDPEILAAIKAAFSEHGVAKIDDLPRHVVEAIFVLAREKMILTEADAEHWNGLVVVCTLDHLSSGKEVVHVSVSATNRKPSDEEVAEVLARKAPGIEMFEHTGLAASPVRHYFSEPGPR